MLDSEKMNETKWNIMHFAYLLSNECTLFCALLRRYLVLANFCVERHRQEVYEWL